MQTTDQFVTRMFETNPDFLFTVTRRASARRRNGIRSTTTSFACTPRIPCRISLPAPAIPCRADDLNGNQGDQDEQQNRASSPDKDARNHQPAKHVNRIANARVEAGGYQFGRPGLNAKSSPKLNPRKRQQKQRWSGDRHPNDLPQSPRLRCGIAAKYDCARGKKDKCDDIELHGSIAAPPASLISVRARRSMPDVVWSREMRACLRARRRTRSSPCTAASARVGFEPHERTPRAPTGSARVADQ